MLTCFTADPTIRPCPPGRTGPKISVDLMYLLFTTVRQCKERCPLLG